MQTLNLLTIHETNRKIHFIYQRYYSVLSQIGLNNRNKKEISLYSNIIIRNSSNKKQEIRCLKPNKRVYSCGENRLRSVWYTHTQLLKNDV